MGVVIGLLVGLGITGLAIYTIIFNKCVTSGELIQAKVVSAIRKDKNIMGQKIPYVQLVLEIESQDGYVMKTLKDQKYHEPDTMIEVWYDSKTGWFQKAELIDTDPQKSPYILLVVGIIWTAIIAGVVWADTSEAAATLYALIMGYFIAFFFIFAGVWKGIVEPIKLKKELGDYEQQGTNQVRNMALLFLVIGIVFAMLIYYFNKTGQFTLGEEENGTNNITYHTESSTYSTTDTSFLQDSCNIRYENSNIASDVSYIEYSYNPLSKGKVYSYTIRIFEGGGEVLLFPHEKQQEKTFRQSILFDVDSSEQMLSDTESIASDELEKAVSEYHESETSLQNALRYMYYYDGQVKTEIGHSSGVTDDDLLFYYAEKSLRDIVPQAVWDAMEYEMKMYYGN